MDWMTFAFHMGSIGAGYLLAVALEWGVHNILFHRLGKREGSHFGFHLFDHHLAVRKSRGGDASFSGTRFAWNGYGREFWGIIAAAILSFPLVFVAPLFWVSAMVCGVHYHVVHTRSHRDVEWCKTHLRWHWDHHMGRNSDMNWGVTNEWFDKLMGTREVWFSRQERAAMAAQAKAAEAAAVGAASAAAK